MKKVLKVTVTNDWGMMENSIKFLDPKEDQTLLDFVREELAEDNDGEDVEDMMGDEECIQIENEEEIKMFFEEGMCSWYLVEIF